MAQQRTKQECSSRDTSSSFLITCWSCSLSSYGWKRGIVRVRWEKGGKKYNDEFSKGSSAEEEEEDEEEEKKRKKRRKIQRIPFHLYVVCVCVCSLRSLSFQSLESHHITRITRISPLENHTTRIKSLENHTTRTNHSRITLLESHHSNLTKQVLKEERMWCLNLITFSCFNYITQIYMSTIRIAHAYQKKIV